MNKRWMFRDKDREEHILDSVLFVDPGLGGTGWAFWSQLSTKPKKNHESHPASTGVLKIPKGEWEGSWIAHAAGVAASFAGLLAAMRPQIVVLEQPGLWSGNATSHASAATGKEGETGDLFKLAYLVGQLALLTKQCTGVLPILVQPYEWKGQLSKDLVFERLAAMGIEAKDHEADAVGMGMAAQGAL
jgi:hypothetical protein